MDSGVIYSGLDELASTLNRLVALMDMSYDYGVGEYTCEEPTLNKDKQFLEQLADLEFSLKNYVSLEPTE